MLTGVELVEAAQSGDEKAFETLVEKHRSRIDATISSFIKNPQDREDIAQETFINAYRNLHQLSKPDSFSYWLVTIAQNLCRNWLNKHQNHTIPIDEVDENLLNSVNSPDREAIETEQHQIIRQAIKTLPESERQIASAHYLEGASHEELVNRHGISYQAVCARLSRAKQKLSKRLSHLLTGVFVFPASTLKKISSGGLTIMKVGTVPKITAGAVAIIILAYIGTRQFISSEEDSSSSVEVVTSTESIKSVAQTDATLQEVVTATPREDNPRISAEEMQQIEDFFAQLDEADARSESDTSQQSTGTALDKNTDAGDATDSWATPEDTTQSAEDVMNAYLKAFRNFDIAGIRSFLTDAAKEEFESSLPMLMGGLPQEIGDLIESSGMSEDKADVTLQMIQGMMQPILKQMFSQAEIVSSEFVGEEFHFRLRVQLPGMSEMLGRFGQDISEVPETFQVPKMPEMPDFLHKMRKENDTWQIY